MSRRPKRDKRDRIQKPAGKSAEPSFYPLAAVGLLEF